MKQLSVILLSFVLFSCGASTGESNGTAQEPYFNKTTLQPVLAGYMKIKDLHVASDAAQAQAEAKAALAQLQDNKDDQSIMIGKSLSAIANTSDLATQRKHFKTLTDDLTPIVKSAGLDQAVFVQYCPMAFNNTGASWLSMSDEVLNPYFGDMMLRCGRVQETIK